METILVLACTSGDPSDLKPALEAAGAAQRLVQTQPGTQFAIGLIGPAAQTTANALASCGASKFFGVTAPEFTQSRYATDAAAAEALCRAASATVVIATGTSRLSRCLPGVAHRLGGRADTHVTHLAGADGKVSLHRWYYRQRMEAVLARVHRPWFILLDPGSQPPLQGAAGSTVLTEVAVCLPENAARTLVAGFRELASGAQTIRPDADLLFVAGAGWTKKQRDGQTRVQDAEKLISDFLRLTRASLGSSKSLVDIGGEGQAVLSFLSHLNQVGQTGSTPRHEKGLATCCHGEEPHTVGWRFIKERRAINLDPNCGWARGKADVLYVADAYEVMAKVNALLAGAA